jgi:uncharacterized DUF497 family protein
MRYYFEWDPAKASLNIQKHKISFQRAAEVFKDPCAISIFDVEHSHDEDRWITMGRDFSGRILVISHTFREIDMDLCRIRIISSRKATKKETKQNEG